MFGALARLSVWLLLAASLVVIGWDEPLRYKFMRRAQIVAEEAALRPPPKSRSPADWQRSATLLEQGPYDRRNGRVEPSQQYDSHGLGSGAKHH